MVNIVTAGLILCFSAITLFGLSSNAQDDGCGGQAPPANGITGGLSVASLSKSEQLNEDYQLKWSFNGTHILFQAVVKAKGYVALGISKTGKMFPADIFIGWVKGDQIHSADRDTSDQYAMPTIDKEQDWALVSANEDGDYTTFNVIRPLNPCDKLDIPITSGFNHIIFAYSDEDPVDDNSISYHFTKRGSKDLDLLEEL